MKAQPRFVTADSALIDTFGSMDAAMAWIREHVSFFVEHYGENVSPKGDPAVNWVCLTLPPPERKTGLWLPEDTSCENDTLRYESVILIRNCVDNAYQEDWRVVLTLPIFALVRKGSVLPLGGNYGTVHDDDILLYKRLK